MCLSAVRGTVLRVESGAVELDLELRSAASGESPPNRPVDGPGVWWGVNLDFDRKTLAQYAADLGHRPAVTVTFTDLPYTDTQRADLARAVEQVRTDGQILLLTLEPFAGLDAVTEKVARQVAADLAEFNAAGVPVIVRLAHEMNGSWYPWGQQPSAHGGRVSAQHAHARRRVRCKSTQVSRCSED
ncbi:glycosyl hydrolase [Rhodococcus pyridinivorans]|nr:glycosyl hydrolase [Rhodococcus pyridinivorans]